mgnify:CR=1 FL=1
MDEPQPDTGGVDNPGQNDPPSLSGSPINSVKAGEQFAFRPTASDPDGDPLTFSVSNKPGWADFDSTSGELSGMPLLGNEGLYSDIRITVSDGEETASIQFNITVTASGSARVTLSWTPPTENEDGTALTDLAGYKIYYGTASGEYTEQIRVENPSVSTYVVDNLSPTTYFFVATAYNQNGLESDYTNELEVMAN